MKKHRQSSALFIKKPSVVATQVALAVFAQLAYAQQPVQTAERVERIEVTGSRIPTVEAEGPSPITVMTQQEIRTDGLSKTEDLLNTLPQVYAAQGSNASNGATGTCRAVGSSIAQRRILAKQAPQFSIGPPIRDEACIALLT